MNGKLLIKNVKKSQYLKKPSKSKDIIFFFFRKCEKFQNNLFALPS